MDAQPVRGDDVPQTQQDFVKRALVTAWNDTAGSVTATLLGGPSITAWPLGWWPAVGTICWVDESGDGTWVCDGPAAAAGAWNTYTPTWTVVTLGNSTVAAAYCRIGKMVTFRLQLVCGSTFAGGTGVISTTVPVTSVAGTSQIVNALVYASANTTFWGGTGIISAGSTTVQPFVTAAAGTANLGQVNNSGVPSVAPFPFTTSSTVTIQGTYECA